MHGSWEPERADHHAPLGQRPGDENNNIRFVVDYFLNRGMTTGKINLGMPIYGRSWTLASNNVVPPCPANGVGFGDGFVAYNDIAAI